MPAYQFVREDVEAISWLLLTIGDNCARCGEQSHFAWLTRDFVDVQLPENKPLFRNLDGEIEHLCGACAGAALVGVVQVAGAAADDRRAAAQRDGHHDADGGVAPR